MVSDKPRAAGQVLLIPYEKIFPNPNQPRKLFDQGELLNLAISIRMNGLLQPITVREVENGYEIVSGERRLRAAKIAGMAVVPCIVIDVNSLKSAVFSLIENLQRQDLGYFEEAVAIEKLMKKYGLSQEEAARKLGKAPSTVSNKLRLLNLPSEIQKSLIESGLSERHARALLKLEGEDISSVLKKVIEKKLNVSQTEDLVEETIRQKNKGKRHTKRMFSDVKIFLKTISSAVETMQSAGIKANFEKEENENSFVYHITIPKNNVYR
ncbi:MAG: ParB/RepB/Spo0J family partition protein [Clostridia bacterium]|nr:ParB/RepB/Spo0J family partition protein [Clostridia bacterium]